MLKSLVCLLAGTLIGGGAFADTVGYSTTGVGPLDFYADTFTLTGQSGNINLGMSTTTANINLAEFYTGDSGAVTASQAVTLTYDLTLDGVTHAVSQSATWNITPSQDTFLAVAASGPVLFDLGSAGLYDVTLNAYTLSSTTIGATATTPTSATFSYVPEPGAFPALALMSLVVGLTMKRKLFSAS